MCDVLGTQCDVCWADSVWCVGQTVCDVLGRQCVVCWADSVICWADSV